MNDALWEKRRTRGLSCNLPPRSARHGRWKEGGTSTSLAEISPPIEWDGYNATRSQRAEWGTGYGEATLAPLGFSLSTLATSHVFLCSEHLISGIV